MNQTPAVGSFFAVLGLMGLPRAVCAAAPLVLSAHLGDHMVVQARQPIVLEGTAEPGAAVQVSVDGGAGVSALPDAAGHWTARIAARPASSDSFRIRVEAGGEVVELRDVVSGEVLWCGGQSNMDFALRGVTGAEAELEDADALGPEIRLLDLTACNPGRRLLNADERARLAAGRVYEGRWARASRAAAEPFSGIGWMVARRVQRELGVPVGVVDASVGGSPMMAWMSPAAIQRAAPGFDPASWRTHSAYPPFARQRGGEHLGAAATPTEAMNHAYAPGSLRRQLPWRGAWPCAALLWYQGETDADLLDPRANAKALDVLLDDFRAAFGPGVPPVCMVQLPRMNRPGWVEFREVQQKVADARDDVDLVPAIDTGDPKDVHPRDKKAIAERMAAVVVRRLRGQAPPVYPRIGKVRFEEDGRAIVEITGAALLRREGPGDSSGFELAGADRVFHPAQAEVAGAVLTLHSPEVSRPVAMRYAWEPVPLEVWRNESGHPLSPARTDDW